MCFFTSLSLFLSREFTSCYQVNVVEFLSEFFRFGFKIGLSKYFNDGMKNLVE